MTRPSDLHHHTGRFPSAVRALVEVRREGGGVVVGGGKRQAGPVGFWEGVVFSGRVGWVVDGWWSVCFGLGLVLALVVAAMTVVVVVVVGVWIGSVIAAVAVLVLIRYNTATQDLRNQKRKGVPEILP